MQSGRKAQMNDQSAGLEGGHLPVAAPARPEPLILFTIFALGSVALSLYLLPRLKGAIVGLQWARLMYGFGKAA